MNNLQDEVKTEVEEPELDQEEEPTEDDPQQDEEIVSEPEEENEEGQEPEEVTEPEPESEKEEGRPDNEFVEWAKTTFPFEEIVSPKDAFKAAMSYVEENSRANQKVLEVLDMQSEIGDIIRDMSRGATFTEALARHVDVDALKPAEGDPDFEIWEKNKKEFKDRQKAIRDLQRQVDRNRADSIKNLEEFRKDKELSEKEMDNFATVLQKTLEKVMDGHITSDFLDIMYKALNFETAVSESRKQGEVKGRNTRIEEIKAKSADKGDGLPHIPSQGQPEKKVNPVAKTIVDFQKNRRRFDL